MIAKLLGLIVNITKRILKKETQSRNMIITSIFITHSLISPLVSFLDFLPCCDIRLMIKKNLVLEIKNLAVNHRSQLVKSNLGLHS